MYKIVGVKWKQQNSNQYEQILFKNGGIVIQEGIVLDTYPIVVLGVGDMEWQAIALGKEGFS
eukprot:11916422-Ditylum_brightwellii.AAC.1